MARIGAQVVAGIGFIGAGTIIVTKRRRVKGLTTAAGLWTNAIIGLSAGAGFYEGAIYTTLIILFLEQFFSKWEYRMLRSAREINLYVEYEHRETLESILQKLREMEVKISDLEVTRSSKEGAKRGSACAVISLMLSKNHPSDEVMTTERAAPRYGLALISPVNIEEMLMGRRLKLFISRAYAVA